MTRFLEELAHPSVADVALQCFKYAASGLGSTIADFDKRGGGSQGGAGVEGEDGEGGEVVGVSGVAVAVAAAGEQRRGGGANVI